MKKWSVFCLLILSLTYVSAQQFPDSQIDGTYYTINNAKLWTVSFGKGNPLFIISGGPGGAHVGLRSLDSLADTCTLIYYDAFGRGKSDLSEDPKEYSITRDIDDLEKLRKAMGYDKINVLGHSYGTVVAQGYAIKYPDKVNHLILIAPFHSYAMWQANDDNCNHEIMTNYPAVWDTLMIVREQGYISRDSIHQTIYGRVPYGFLYAYNPDYFSKRSSSTYPNRFNSKLYYQMVGPDGDFKVESDIGTFDYRDKLKQLKMPVLILAGRYDRVAVPSMMVKYKTYCPQAQFYIFEKSGHNPFVEQPKKTFKLLKEFLNN